MSPIDLLEDYMVTQFGFACLRMDSEKSEVLFEMHFLKHIFSQRMRRRTHFPLEL